MELSFAEQTAVETQTDGTYVGTIPSRWDIAGIVNGGLVLSMALRAMADRVDKPDPLSLNAHFARPAQPGPVAIEVDLGRQGRTLSTVSGVLRQDGKELLRTTATFGDFDTLDGPSLPQRGRPDIAPFDRCERAFGEAPPGEFFPPPFVNRFEIHHDPRYGGFQRGQPAGDPIMAGWMALNDQEALDAAALTLFADAMPPTIFNTDLPIGWAPTIELTVHFRQRPKSTRLAVHYSSDFVFGGLFSGDVELWDPEAGLIVEGRQLALLPKA